MRIDNSLNWKVGGPAGEGIMTTGLIFSKVVSRHGWQVFDYTEYPSLITGGHNTYQVYAQSDFAGTQVKMIDVLVAMDKTTLGLHFDELNDQSIILYDSLDDKVKIDDYAGLKGKKIDLPMVSLAQQAGGTRLMANNVALGASIYLFGLDLEVLNGVISDIFGRKGEEIVKENQAAAKAGYDFVMNNFGSQLMNVTKNEGRNYLTMTGNEAASLGAIAGGLQFYAAYPMTPSSSILHTLAAKASDADIVVKHAEDEIGVINMALGASYTGVRSACGSSGGGFAYMTEALGLAGVAEIPLVVFESMRPGPALGMPTWTGQGDLQFILTASQDEFPRFVLTPGDALESFHMTRLAFDLAEKYQTLAVVVLDKHLSESRYTMTLDVTEFKNDRHGFAEDPALDGVGFYPRYEVTESGVHDRSIPGQVGGNYIANSYEHDKYGFATEEGWVRIEQMDKRNKKFEMMKQEILPPYIEDNGGEMTLVGFGSTKGVLQAGRELLNKEGIKVNILNVSWMWPFPIQAVSDFLNRDLPFAIVEGNSTGQFANVLRQETGLVTPHHFRKYDGRPFYPHEIVEFVKNTLKK